MARLPEPGNDSGVWGNILNQFLQVSHNADGSLTTSAVTSAGGYTKPGGGIPKSDLDGSVQSSLSAADSAVQTVNGKTGPTVSLSASDVGAPTTLAGDGDVTISSPSNGQVLTYNNASSKWVNQTSPTAPVTSVAGKTGAVTLVEGDIQNLTTDLAAKAADSTVVHLSGTETVTGNKNFTGTLQHNSNAVVDTTDSRLSDARTPLAHASTHASGGSDPVTPASIGALVSSLTTAASTSATQQGLWTINNDPLSTDPNLFEIWTKSPGGSNFLGSWMNERGLWRAELKDTWESCYKAIIPTTQTGNPIQIERRNGDNSRTIIGGFNASAQYITTLQSWSVIASVDPNSTGKYTIATTDAFSTGDSIDSLALRFDTDDVIRMRGQIAVTATGTTSGDLLFNLPSGFSPGKSRTLGSATTGGALVTIQIRSNGQVLARRTIAGPFSLSFDDLTYHK